jgi:peptidoglycan/xylan/chitin deacetylase (PgdA/CDA1 family)
MLYKPPLILLYHKIKEVSAGGTLCVTPTDFQNHMQYLLENSFSIIPFYDIINEPFLNDKRVVITFDDGYKNNYLSAYPILTKFKIPATIFIVAGLVGQRSLWDEKNGWPSDELLSWPQVEEMARSGIIIIGSHSQNHYHLTKMGWPVDLWREIYHSKKTIEERIHKKVLFFSYPFGRCNILIRQMVKLAGYAAACGTNLPDAGVVDIYNLPRLEINTAVGPLDKFANLIKKYLN